VGRNLKWQSVFNRGADLCYTTDMSAPGTENLAKKLLEQVPEDLLYFIRKSGDLAQRRQQRLYLVGGAVRDLLLERCTLDIDLVVEGDAVKMAPEMASLNRAEVMLHPQFGTAKIRWRNRSADIASARAETYARPGVLPSVRPGTIEQDLARRDFAVNAMAIELNPTHFGELIDLHGGRQDIGKRLIRVLHDRSFVDDATRIWRAVRYEQRLDFNIEPATLGLINRDIDRLDAISGDRIRHELELVLKEDFPVSALRRAGELDLLAKINPSLRWDEWLEETLAAAAERSASYKSHPHLSLALLLYRLTGDETENVIRYLHFPKVTAQVLRDMVAIRAKSKDLAVPGQAPSTIYELLHGYHLIAIEASAIGCPSETAAEHIALYRDVLRHVKPSLTGEDLKKLGIPEGPGIKEVLKKLREARLDGKIDSREGEVEIVRRMAITPPS
jgi:tRNA nucleotidyltransferase (CCA-adding enzyme)